MPVNFIEDEGPATTVHFIEDEAQPTEPAAVALKEPPQYEPETPPVAGNRTPIFGPGLPIPYPTTAAAPPLPSPLSPEPFVPIPKAPPVEQVPPTAVEKGLLSGNLLGVGAEKLLGTEGAVQLGRSGVNLAGSLPEFLTSPLGITATAVGRVAPTLVAGAFAVDTLRKLPDAIADVAENWGEMTKPQKIDAITQLAGQTALGVGLGVHTVKGGLKAGERFAANREAAARAKTEAAGPGPIPEATPEEVAAVEARAEVLDRPVVAREAIAELHRTIKEQQFTQLRREADQQLRQQKKAPPPEVPGTEGEPYETVLQSIRNANAKTIGEIQRLFPKANLSREQARPLRDAAFGGPPVQVAKPKPPAPTIQDVVAAVESGDAEWAAKLAREAAAQSTEQKKIEKQILQQTEKPVEQPAPPPPPLEEQAALREELAALQEEPQPTPAKEVTQDAQEVQRQEAVAQPQPSPSVKQQWRKAFDARSDAFQKNSILERVANSGIKASDADLVEVLNLLNEKEVGSNAWNVAWAVSQNPSASPATKARALAMREDWMRPGREEPSTPPARGTETTTASPVAETPPTTQPSEAGGGVPDIDIKQGDKIRWEPNEKERRYQGPVDGIVQDVIRNSEGEIGFHIFAPTEADPSNVVRVWANRGKVVSRESAKMETEQTGVRTTKEPSEIRNPKRPKTVVEIADEIAAQGVEPSASYGLFVKARNLKPEIDAKDWLPVYRQSLELARLAKLSRKPQPAPTAQPTAPNATTQRPVTEGGQPQYLGTDAQRATTETGNRNRPVESGAQPETPPSSGAQTGQERVLLKPEEGGEISIGPGAAAPSDVGATRSDMVQLTQSLENAASPKLTIEQRVARAKDAVKNLPLKTAEVSESVRNGVLRLKAIGSAIKTTLTTLPEFTGYKRIFGKWDGATQQAAHELREFVKSINKRIRPERQVAITNWIQANGDNALLLQRAAASRTEKLRRGYVEATRLSPDEITVAQNIREYLDSKLEEGIESGLLTHGLENYITQIWKRPNPATDKLVSDISLGRLQTNFKYARQRIFDSYFEGEQAGYVPANKTVGALIAAYDESFNRALLSRSFIKQLTMGTAKDGRPFVEPSGIGQVVSGKSYAVRSPEATRARRVFDTEAEARAEAREGEIVEERNNDAILIKPRAKPEELADYRIIDHPALRKWNWAANAPDGTPVIMQGQLMVHPEIYQHLKNNLTKSVWLQHPVPRAILYTGRGIKELMFTASLFHQTQETLHALGHRVNPANLESVDFSKPWLKEATEHGLQVADYHAMELFQEGLSSGSLVSKVPLIGKRILGPYTEWLFQDYIPRIKVTMYKHALERNLDRYGSQIESGKITRDQVVELTAKQANAAFGELNYKWMGRNPSTQSAMRAFLIAPDFLEARAKFVGQAARNYGQEQLVALGLLAITQYITARILNQVLDDDPHWAPKDAFKFIAGEHSYELRTIPGDLVHLASDPWKFSMARLSPQFRTAVTAVSGRDYRGVRRDAIEQVKDFAKLPIPLPFRPEDDRRWWETFINAFGLHEKSYTHGQHIGEMAREYRESIKGKPEVEIIESPDSPYRMLRISLDDENEVGAIDAIQRLLKTREPKSIEQAMKQGATSGFTGMKKAYEERFFSQLNEADRQKYFAAMREKQERYRRFLRVWPKAVKAYRQKP